MARKNDSGEDSAALTSLTTAAAELKYERSTIAFDILAKEEDLRKLRLNTIFLYDELDVMSDKLCEESERAEDAELDAVSWQVRAEEATTMYENVSRDLQIRDRELETLRIEVESHQTVSAESTKLLAAKLALTRELANIRPEVEHLRSQALTHQNLLSEKLSLQQQLETAQSGLEDSNRKLQRAIAREGKLNEQDARYEMEIEELEKQLAKVKKDQVKVEKKLNAEASEQLAVFQKERDSMEKRVNEGAAEQVKLLEKELSKERKAREKTEKSAEAKNSDEVSLLKKELAKEKCAREKAEQANVVSGEKVELMESLRKQLAQAKKAQAEAEKSADALQGNIELIQTLRKELSKEKKAREKAEKTLTTKSNDDEALTIAREEHAKDLAKERKAREKAENPLGIRTDTNDERISNLEKELRAEQSVRATVEKQLSKSAAEFEDQKSVLDDKLEQFRSKLRSTKEKLKEAEKDLVEARNQAQALPSVAAKTTTKTANPRKRPITQVTIDPDATIGTPGDGPGGRAMKRGKRASSVVGEKSTFSITPFLNRTSKVAPEDLPLASIEESDASPTVERTLDSSKQGTSTSKALTSPFDINSKVPAARRKAAAAPSKLAQVTEEEQSDNEPNVEHTAASVMNDENVRPIALDNSKTKDISKHKMILKASSSTALKPKSLSSFATFRDGSVPPQYHRQKSVSVGPQQQEKKKRKLVGLASTIFDEDEEDAVTDTHAAMKSLGRQRGFGAFKIGRALGGLSVLGKSSAAGLKRGPLVVAKEDGFMFSPLKRNKRAMSVAGE